MAYLRKFIAALTALIFIASLVAPSLAQSTAQVTIDGQPVNLNPPPIERAGRIFVPLRGVFERLGASVVYQSGQINATAGSRTVALTIGSTNASISGQPTQLDVAPFIVGASTYVPLRFVAQALGANVNWDGVNRIVAIQTGGGAPPPPAAAPPQAPQGSPISLASVNPQRGASVSSERPTIEAQFTGAVANPNSLRIQLDGLDITNSTTRAPQGIVYSPPSNLIAGQHTVRITGQDRSDRPFRLSWSFTTGTNTTNNFVDIYSPAANQPVGMQFTVRGRTAPNARVVVQAASEANVGNFVALDTGSFRGQTIADANGSYAINVVLNGVRGGAVNLVVTSTDPVTRATAQARRSLRA